VLREIGADIVALQEVASAQAHENFLRDLEHATGYRIVAGLLRQRHGSDFGNAVLSRYPVASVRHLDLAVGAHEPRGALDVCIDVGSPVPLRVIATHLGLRPGERREQVRRIVAAVERDSPHPTLLMGDLNEWYLWGRPLRWLHAHFRETPAAPRTFPHGGRCLRWTGSGCLRRGRCGASTGTTRRSRASRPIICRSSPNS
jgi:endonuclease/exonuclease/phosphatase family metal-dependent hydrolase